MLDKCRREQLPPDRPPEPHGRRFGRGTRIAVATASQHGNILSFHRVEHEASRS